MPRCPELPSTVLAYCHALVRVWCERVHFVAFSKLYIVHRHRAAALTAALRTARSFSYTLRWGLATRTRPLPAAYTPLNTKIIFAIPVINARSKRMHALRILCYGCGTRAVTHSTLPARIALVRVYFLARHLYSALPQHVPVARARWPDTRHAPHLPPHLRALGNIRNTSVENRR